MTRRLIALFGCFFLLLTSVQPAIGASTEPLVLGVFPNLPARQIVEIYRPVASALEKQLRRRVVVYSARDFKTFVASTRQGAYDIVLTAPHMAWLARQEAGYRPLLKYTQSVRGMLVVKANSPFDSVTALRGHTIATADSMAVAVLAVQAEIASQGIQHTTDYTTFDAGTHLNAVMQLLNGRADAAMLGMHAYMLMPADVRPQLRVLIETPPLSSLMYLTHPRVRDAEAQSIRKALLHFAATPEGQTFMQRGGYGGFAHVTGDELRAFRPYADQLQKMLQDTR